MISSEDGSLDVEKYIVAALSAAGQCKFRCLRADLENYVNVQSCWVNAMIERTLKYGAEIWVPKEREKQSVQAAEVRVLRKKAGIDAENRLRRMQTSECMQLG